MSKTINYAELSNEDLKNRIAGLRVEASSATQKFRMGQFKKTSEFARIRKDIARAMTLLRARELGLSPTEGKSVEAPAVAPATKKAPKAKAAPKKSAAKKTK